MSAVGGPIWTKLGSDSMLITSKWSRSKPDVEFQYGGRLFFQTGSSYSSAVNWGMSTKFGLLIAIDLLKTLISINGKLELELSSRGRHLEKSIWRHVSALGGTICIKFGSCVQNIMRITVIWSRSKPEEEFQYGGRLFSKPQIVISQPWTEFSWRNLVCW